MKRLRIPAALLCIPLLAAPLRLVGSEVIAHIELGRAVKPTKGRATRPANVVLWLNPLSQSSQDPSSLSHPSTHPGRYRLVQHNKAFSPHLLVIPVGSNVDFPNQDPFFHNVFSLYNGKRFDLGLYESGSSRTVRFDHEGVSYIFCNIHPEMGAVVIALRTPYFAMSSSDGKVVFPDVPAGTYELNVWAEGGNASDLKALSRRVQITAATEDLGRIQIPAGTDDGLHKNKFGEEYPPPAAPVY